MRVQERPMEGADLRDGLKLKMVLVIGANAVI
ncbi:hypothetical protein ES703_47315 [subsurface metagenome]